MKTKTFNIIITVLIWSLFAYIGFTAAVSYTPEPKTVDTNQTEALKVWKQSVIAEYNHQNISYKGDETK